MSKEIQELGYEVLNAVRRGELSVRDAKLLCNKTRGSISSSTQSKFRSQLRKALGADNLIVEAFDNLVEVGRRKKLSIIQEMYYLGPNRPSPAEWGDKISIGQKRSWASGKRKPFPDDHGERISRGRRKARQRNSDK